MGGLCFLHPWSLVLPCGLLWSIKCDLIGQVLTYELMHGEPSAL